MKRRSLLAGAAAASLTCPLPGAAVRADPVVARAGLAGSGVAGPAVAGGTRTLRMVPQVALNSIDPVWSSSQISRNMGFMVFDLLYGRDEAMNARPQMVDADLVEDGFRRWTLRLREQLWWHDGEKVLARDCVASLQRWMRRNPAGGALAARLDAIEVIDDRSFVFRLNRPYPHLRVLLSQFIIPPVMMPERLAATDPFRQVAQAVGSGPFRWLADEHVLGSHAAFARFDRYVPRDEPASYTAGGHRALVDRVEWKMIPDAQTAANALATGEVDWMEIPLPDLIPMLKEAKGVVTGNLDDYGQILFMRPNHAVAPTSNPAIRQAMLAAIDQREVMEAVMGGDAGNAVAPIGFLQSGRPEVDDVGMAAVRTRHTPQEVKAMLDQAGYQNERLVLLHPSDHIYYNPTSAVVSELLAECGFNIDDQIMDWATVQARRTSREALSDGGWSIFCSVAPVPDYRDPLLAAFIRGDGAKGWFGWAADAGMERIYDAWLETTDPAEQTRLEQDYEREAFRFLPFIPLGRYRQTSAWRDDVRGILKGPSAVFWNIAKA